MACGFTVTGTFKATELSLLLLSPTVFLPALTSQTAGHATGPRDSL